MHAGGRFAPVAGLTMLSAILLQAGCRTPANLSRPGNTALEPEERRLSEALAHYSQGILYEVQGSAYSSNSLHEFAEASRLDPSRTTVNARTAVTALMQNKPAVAIEALERSCKAKPKSVEHHLDLATAYQVAERFDDSVRVLQYVIRLDSTRENAYLALANIHLCRDRDAEALGILRKALRKTKAEANIVAYVYGQGARLFQEKQVRRAIPFFLLVLERANNNRQELQHLVAQLYESVGDKPTALRYFRLAAGEPQPVAQAVVKLAIEEYAASPDNALHMLEKSLQRLPDNTLILLAMGQVLASQDHLPEALACFEKVMKISSEPSAQRKLTQEFYLQYVGLLDRAGRGVEAEAMLEKCIEVHPDAADALNYLAYSWAERGIRIPRALTYIQRALKIEPDNGAFLDTLGWVYYRMGRYADAALLIAQSLETIPEDATLLEHMGDALDMLGCPEDATEHWKRSFLANPSRLSAAERLRARGVPVEEILRKLPAASGRKPARVP
jgi:tetratricopeptide (TPR) repeat protein